MKRRTFFGGLVAATGGLFGMGRTEANVRPAEFDPTVPSRLDAQGTAVCRVYRETEDDRTGQRVWLEIQVEDIRVGDRIIRVGQDGRRLWCADALTVTEITGPYAATGLIGVKFSDEVNLRENPDGPAKMPPSVAASCVGCGATVHLNGCKPGYRPHCVACLVRHEAEPIVF